MHLRIFIQHYRICLPAADIFVIEQADNKPFNRAKLLNIGALEAEDYDYYAFHDVDMISMNGADYSYPDQPTHLAARCGQFGFKMPYPNYFGGVTLFNKIDFIKVNGYSNEFWGWGAEDDEMLQNIRACGLTEIRREGAYGSLGHKRIIKQEEYNLNVRLLDQGRTKDDGLSHCKYELVSRINKLNFTHILAIC